MATYIPRKGDLVTLTFDPQAGHEQRGRRPALVVSNDLFNRHTGLCFACPITNTSRGFSKRCPRSRRCTRVGGTKGFTAGSTCGLRSQSDCQETRARS